MIGINGAVAVFMMLVLLVLLAGLARGLAQELREKYKRASIPTHAYSPWLNTGYPISVDKDGGWRLHHEHGSERVSGIAGAMNRARHWSERHMMPPGVGGLDDTAKK